MEREYFYDKPIIRDAEEEIIENILAKYKDYPADEKLKELIWNDLQEAKFQGTVTIPFKVVLNKDVYNKYPTRVDVILDTKV